MTEKAEMRRLDAETWVRKTCDFCDVVFRLRRCHVRAGQTRFFCGYKCARLGHRGIGIEHKGTWYGIGVHGYLKAKNGNVLHRVIWQETHGKIPADHDIHHKDGNKLNNAVENLECISHAQHSIQHNSTGTEIGFFVCLFCRKTKSRAMREIRKGQNKYCSRACYHGDRRK